MLYQLLRNTYILHASLSVKSLNSKIETLMKNGFPPKKAHLPGKRTPGGLLFPASSCCSGYLNNVSPSTTFRSEKHNDSPIVWTTEDGIESFLGGCDEILDFARYFNIGSHNSGEPSNGAPSNGVPASGNLRKQ